MRPFSPLFLLLLASCLMLPLPSAARTADGPTVTIVKAKTPWYAPRFLVRSRFVDAVPEYRQVPGLVRKYFTIADDGWLGGIYLWESRAAAEAFYDDAWHARIQDRYGEPAELAVFSSPLQIDGQVDAPRAVATVTGTAYFASVVRIARTSGASEDALRRGFEEASPSHAGTAGLLRKYYSHDDADFGGVYLWKSRAAAEAFHGEAWRRNVEQRFGQAARVEYFEAPVVLNNRR